MMSVSVTCEISVRWLQHEFFSHMILNLLNSLFAEPCGTRSKKPEQHRCSVPKAPGQVGRVRWLWEKETGA